MRPASRAGAVAAWAGVSPLAALALARLATADRWPLTAALNAGSSVVYLPAYPALAVGISTGRRGLALVAGTVAGLHLAWSLPELVPARRRAARAGAAFRVVSANVQFTAPGWSRLGAELARLAPDVLLVQELTPDSLASLERSGAFAEFDHCHLDPRPGSFGSGIWSRHPLDDAETWNVAGGPMTRATVKVGSGLRLYNVHTRSPLVGGLPRWHAQLRLIAAEAALDRSTTGMETVVAGDFNATWHHQGFRRLLRSGLRDAHAEAGRGWAPTWRPRRGAPPLLRLDHVLISSGIDVVGAGEGTGGGDSDHRPVMADLVLVEDPRPRS